MLVSLITRAWRMHCYTLKTQTTQSCIIWDQISLCGHSWFTTPWQRALEWKITVVEMSAVVNALLTFCPPSWEKNFSSEGFALSAVWQRKVWGLLIKLWLSWTTFTSAALILKADCCLHVGLSFHDVTECWVWKGELLNVILSFHRCRCNEGHWIHFVLMF